MDEGEVFDLNSISDYELLSNEDGTVLIQDNCVVIKHKQTAEIKMLPLSDEVLQALGLALVLEDEEDKKDHAAVQIHMEEMADGDGEGAESVLQEFMIERLDDPQAAAQANHDKSQTEEEGEEEVQEEGQGMTSIVFTDDEDADMDRSQEGMDVDDSSNQVRDVLVWSQAMVSGLLDLYEELQDQFLQNRNHKHLWHEIYVRMCMKFPELQKWSEQHVQSKFNGLKRTYRGAALYLRENMHTTKWLYFDRMKRIMDKSGESDTESPDYKIKQNYPDNTNVLTWKRKWTLRMLDVYDSLHASGERGAVFWSNVRDQVIATEADFESVSVEQLKRKLFSLKRLYKVHRARPQLRLPPELRDTALYERLAKICEREGTDSEGEAEGGGGGEEREQHWTRAHTDYLLDLCAGAGGARNEIIEEVSERMRQRFGDVNDFSSAKCQQKLSSLRHTFTTILEKKPPQAWRNVSWPYFEKCLKIFHKPLEIWSRGNTLLLVEVYARVRRYLDENGSRFWTELAEKFKQQKPGLVVTPRKCEMKMQALFAKYKSLLRRDSAQRADTWPLFKKMDVIFGAGSRSPWPLAAQQQLLTLYQQRLHLLELGAAQAVFDDIADVMAKMFPKLAVSGDICQKRLQDMKAKYVSLSQDARAAAAWPLYTRMSEIFATHLWSKSNVNHLIDAFIECTGKSGPGGGGGGGLWARVAAAFTRRSAAGAAAAHQCRTEFNVLRARYNQLCNGDPAVAEKWPFYEKMHQIFSGGGDLRTPRAPAPQPAPRHLRTIVTDAGQEIKVSVLNATPIKQNHDEVKQAVKQLNASQASMPGLGELDAADSDSSHDSIADQLEELLVERPAKRARTETPEPTVTEEEEEEETPTRISTRSVQQKVEWSAEETQLLLEAYSELRNAGGGDGSRTWTALYKKIKNNLTGRKTAGHCSEKINQLKSKYKAIEKSGKKDKDSEMSDDVYQKMKSMFETQAKPKENGTPAPSAGADSDLLQKMLQEIQTKNELQKKRSDATKKYYEEKSKREIEKLKVLKKIEQNLAKLLEKEEMSKKVLIETLEECLKD